MQVQASGQRPKLSLAYGGTNNKAAHQRRSPALSSRELRHIVAAMVD